MEIVASFLTTVLRLVPPSKDYLESQAEATGPPTNSMCAAHTGCQPFSCPHTFLSNSTTGECKKGHGAREEATTKRTNGNVLAHETAARLATCSL